MTQITEKTKQAVNGSRLWKRLMEMAKIGGTADGGVCREALTDVDKAGRDLFVRWCREAGCSIEIDRMGNIFARRSGLQNDSAAVMTGSHLDSQPTGGKFDGVYGVLAGLEVIETLNDLDITTSRPVEIAVWTNEEGARFAPPMIASGVYAGVFDLEYGLSRTDKQGRTIGDELQRIGYAGELPVGNRNVAVNFELHIEQGPVLETAGKSVGVVTGVQGMRWYYLTLKGQEVHAGPTPMEHRRDPVMGAAAILPRLYQMVEGFAPDSRITFGDFNAVPGVANTVPSSLMISIDLRHPDTETLKRMDEELRKIVAAECERLRLTVGLDEYWNSPPVMFAPECIEAVRKGVEAVDADAMDIVSGAGHDAVYISKVIPTGMIFVPCNDGISHNPAESITPEDAKNGCNVLLHAMLEAAC